MKYESQYYGVVQMEDIIEHHGIKGMKWGVRNGPPYPLNSSTHKRVVKSRTDKGRTVYGSKSKKAKDSSDHSRSGIKTVALKTAALGVTGYRMGQLASALATGYNIVMSTPVGYLSAPGVALGGALAAGYIGKKVLDTSISAIKEKKRTKRVEGLETDAKTGLKKKDRDWSREEDAKAVNPSFKNFNDNTKNNCMLCTTAYDLRRRGYDVSANKASYGYTSKDLKEWYPKAEVKVIDYKPYQLKSKLISGTREALVSQGNGARGNLMVSWEKSFSGHSMAYEVRDGEVHVYDAQVGKEVNINRVLRNSNSASYARLDNVEPDWKKVKGLVR